jgi:phosphatidylinositol alpha-mannosyltransferase
VRIALVSPYDWAVPGGVNQHIRHLADEFVRAGHYVRIIAPCSDAAGCEAADDRLICIGRPRSIPTSGSVARITFSWRWNDTIDRVLEANQFDVVHMHEPLIPSLTFQFLRQATTVRVATFHAARDGGHLVYATGKRILKRWFRRLDGKIAVSVAANRLIGRYFAGYYNIIPNGIDLARFSGRHQRLKQFDDGKRNIVFVGRLEKRKGVKYLLRAFVRIHSDYPDTRLIIVGEGKLREGYERSMLNAGIDDVVFTGHVSEADLPRYYASADVCCAPATGHESFGIVLLEAMASGKPVVASNIEGYAAVLTNGVEGLLVRPKDPEAIAGAIEQLLNSTETRAAMGAKGRVRAQEFSWERVSQRVLSYYERLLYERTEMRELHDATESGEESAPAPLPANGTDALARAKMRRSR